jgi:hypothetical protein
MQCRADPPLRRTPLLSRLGRRVRRGGRAAGDGGERGGVDLEVEVVRVGQLRTGGKRKEGKRKEGRGKS